MLRRFTEVVNTTRGASLAALAISAISLWLGTATTARAATPISPSDGETTASTPTFSWRLESDDRSDFIEFSPNPAAAGGGGFADDREKRTDLLQSSQTSYSIGTNRPLFAGTWYWHVHSSAADFSRSGWTATRRIVVRDEPIALRRVRIGYLNCLRELQVSFEYSDNDRTPARYAIELRRKKRGRRVVTLRTRADDDGLGGSTVFEDFRRPRRLRKGVYYAQLVAVDSASHVTRSRTRRLRIRECGE